MQRDDDPVSSGSAASAKQQRWCQSNVAPGFANGKPPANPGAASLVITPPAVALGEQRAAQHAAAGALDAAPATPVRRERLPDLQLRGRCHGCRSGRSLARPCGIPARGRPKLARLHAGGGEKEQECLAPPPQQLAAEAKEEVWLVRGERRTDAAGASNVLPCPERREHCGELAGRGAESHPWRWDDAKPACEVALARRLR
mmetsp:Transcript_30225/g.94602  ORF Transcript_30225/g.94602 Transcript_30225/m.94602 type:complete len:201 (-) Transcript_30225:325-927(-)